MAQQQNNHPTTTSCRMLKMSVDIQAVHHGPLHVTDYDGNYSKEFNQVCQAFKDLTANRWSNEPLSEEGPRLTYFWGQVRNRNSRRIFLFSIPSPPTPPSETDDTPAEYQLNLKLQAKFAERFPFIPRRGEFVTVFYANSYENEQRVALQNDDDPDVAAADMCRRLDVKEKLHLFAVGAKSIEPCCGRIDSYGIVQLVDRSPERVCIVECGAPAESMGQVFLDDQSAEESGICLRHLHVGDRVLFSAVQNLHKVKFPLRPYKMSRMRLMANTLPGRTAANITIECLNGEFRRGGETVGRFSTSVPKGTVLTFEVNIDTLMCDKTVLVKGYRLLPPRAAYEIDDLKITHSSSRRFDDNNDDSPESYALNDKWPLSYMDRSCLLAAQPSMDDVSRQGDDDDSEAGIDSEKVQPIAYAGMYKWECEVGAKQTAKLQLKFVAARTGPFRANFALLTHNCEILVPIRIDVFDGGRAPRLLIDTGCFRGQTASKSLNATDKFNLYALRHQLHHHKLIGWFDRRGVEMWEPSQFTTLDCQFGTHMVLDYLLRFEASKFGLCSGGASSTVFDATERSELFQDEQKNDAESESDESDSDNDSMAAGAEADNCSLFSHATSRGQPVSKQPPALPFPVKQKVTSHNFTKVYKIQLQTEAVWRSWQYMEASLRNPRIRLSASGRILYIDMSSNRSFLSHVQRIDDKCFMFLYVIEAGEQLPATFDAAQKQQFVYDPTKLRQRFLHPKQKGGYTMVALAVNRVKNNELLCALPEGLELPFIDYSAEFPKIRLYHDAPEEKDEPENPQLFFANRPKPHTPPNFTLFVSFKTLMVNLRRAYDALEIVQHSVLKPALAKILFPEQVKPFAVEFSQHVAVNRKSSDSSVASTSATTSDAKGTAAATNGFGLRARHPADDLKLSSTVAKCSVPHVYTCPLPDCSDCRQRQQTDNNPIVPKKVEARRSFSTPLVPRSLLHPPGIFQKRRIPKFSFENNSTRRRRSSSCSSAYSSAGTGSSSSGCRSIYEEERRPRLPMKNLDTTQQSVVNNVEAGCSRPSPYVLIGPPGTGKTRTLASAILQVVQSDKTARVLIVASSNVAADLLYTLLTTGKQDVLVPDSNELDDEGDEFDDKIIFEEEDGVPTTKRNASYISSADSIASSGYSTGGSSANSPVKLNPDTESINYMSNGNAAKSTVPAHHADADIVPRDKILKPGTDIVRLFSDEHGRSNLISTDVRADGICLKYSELKSENNDDPLLTSVSAVNHTNSVQKALSARVCVCTPSLAAHLHRRILDTNYSSKIGGKYVRQMRYRAEPYTHLFVDEAGKCAEAELIVPMLALNLMPLIPPPPPTPPSSPAKVPSSKRSSRTRGSPSKSVLASQIPPIAVCTGHLKRDLAAMPPPLVMLAGDPHQLGPSSVAIRNNNSEDVGEENQFFSTASGFATLSSTNDDTNNFVRPPETLCAWDSVKMSLLTRLFEQYSYVQRRLAAANSPAPVLMTVLRHNYRNPQIIAEFLSKYFYHGHVVAEVPPAPLDMPSMVLVKHEKLAESRDEGPSVYNIEEARIVADLAMQFIRPCENKYQFWTKFSVLRKNVTILTPYRNQANAIRIQLFRALEEQIGGLLENQNSSSDASPDWFYNKLRERTGIPDMDPVDLKDVVDFFLPVVATIDEYQGREADNIILSLVRSRFTVPSMNEMLLKHFQNEIGLDGTINAESTIEERVAALRITQKERESVCDRYMRRVLGFVADDTRINEAITRACRRLFIVSNKKLLQLCPTWSELLKHAAEVDADKLNEIVL